MNKPRNLSGHFRSIFTSGVNTPTTITSQRKSKVKEIEAARRDALCREIEEITGSPATRVARSIDGIRRRWNGIKGNGAGVE